MTIPAPATDLPWHLHDMEDATICGPDRMAIGLFFASSRVDEDNIKNAAFARTACNSFPALVECLGELIAHKDRPPNEAHPGGAFGEIEMWRKARAVLSLALGEQ